MFDRGIWRCCRLFIPIIFLTWVPYVSQAKTAGLTVIAIYPGSDGQNVAQITGFMLNGKNEVYPCGGTGNIEKSAYHKLTKVSLGAGMTLERNAQGVLMLTVTGQPPVCVVPGNLKLDKEEALSPSALADRAVIDGSVLPGSDPPIAQIPALKPGIRLVFVAVADNELANYLRASRQGDIPGWKRYLAADATGSHLPDARKALSSLYQKVAVADLSEYTNSKSSDPNFGKLAEARQMADQAQRQVSDDPATAALSKNIHAEVLDLSQQSTAKLNLYRDAMKQQTPGYVNLVAAEHLADGAFLVEPSTPEAISAEQQSKLDRSRFDNTLRDTEQQIAGQHPDEAARAIAPVQAFSQENPKVGSDLKSIAALYVARAKKSETAESWTSAVSDLQKAQALVPSPDTVGLLSSAQQQAQIAANKAAAQTAMQKSQDAEASGDIIRAYEVLDNLPTDPKGLVSDRLQSLREQYVKAAEDDAKSRKKAHEPINGMADEQGIQTAYQMLRRCYGITQDPALADQIEVLGDEMAAWYLQQGKKYVEKPDGTGVNVGWTYLEEASSYKSQSNIGAVRDEMEVSRRSHQLKSQLSIRVEFRDQTSRRDQVAFSDQLTDAMATQLESAMPGVVVIRPRETPPVQPNFQMVGDVLKHDLGKTQAQVLKDSKYRSGELQVPNPDWVKLNKEREQAKDDLDAARAALQEAQNRNKKKEIETAKGTVDDNEKKLRDFDDKLSMLPQFNSQQIERPYTYTIVTYQLHPLVEIQFRILDSSSNEVVPRITVEKEVPAEYSHRINVSSVDTQGVRPDEGTQPDDNDYFEKSENAARDMLIDAAKQKVSDLPAIVLKRADARATEGDNEGAAELYLLYLNSTPNKGTADRARAMQFLETQFNFRDLNLGLPAA